MNNQKTKIQQWNWVKLTTLYQSWDYLYNCTTSHRRPLSTVSCRRRLAKCGTRLGGSLWMMTLLSSVHADLGYRTLLVAFLLKQTHMSRPMGKPTICIGENKGADQHRSNCEADQRLGFCYTDSTIPLLFIAKVSSLLLWLHRPICVAPGRKPRRPVF